MLPSGVVTFWFTDVVGSTRMWETEGEAMGPAMVRHDAIIESAVAEARGLLVRPRGEGDSRFAVFEAPVDAVVAAAELTVALHTEQWPTSQQVRVRTALHTGEADLRAGDYYGDVVNRCARLRSVAHPGQVLLTATTAELVELALPPLLTVRYLGEHKLKDLTRPEQVFQLVDERLPGEFPPLVTPRQAESTAMPQTVRAGAGTVMAQLEGAYGRVVPVGTNGVHVGRMPDNALALDDPKVSRYHAVVAWTSVGFVVADLNSTNGTRVNEEPVVGRSLLADGDELIFGDHRFTFQLLSDWRP